MDVKFEVLLSSSIKRRKPWPRFCWLGREKEGVFLLDDNRISEVHLLSGRTKKKIPKLQPLLQRVVSMSASHNGVWLVGLLVSGELFLWNKDKDLLKTVSAVPAVHQLVSSIKGSATTLGLSLLVSENAQRVFLAALTGQVFLWECTTPQELSGPRDATVTGRWSHISCHEDTQLPSVKDKEASVHSVFVKNQAVGDACLSAFVFTADGKLTVTLLKIQWDSTWENKLSSVGFSVHWSSKCFPLDQLLPPCKAVKSRGALVPAFSPDAQLLAVVLNQRDPRATQVLFISTQNFVTVSSRLGGCGIKTLIIPDKYVRSYWVCSVSWTAEGLYLACVLKRGSLLMLARLGGLVSLATTGCSIEFSAAHFLPLHPLVTYRPPVALQTQDGGLSSSSVSLRDPMRQRFSVTCHPRQPLLIVSDGYMITALRMTRRPCAVGIMSTLLVDAAQGLENIREVLCASQPQVRSWLESMSSLTFTGSLLALKERESPLSTLPLYLQGTGDLTPCPETAQDEEDHDSDEDRYACSRMEDGGKLEFASMFDTLHAQAQADPESTATDLPEDLNRVHKNLLRAWALAFSLGGSMEQRERLLKFTILCIVRLVKLLRVSDSSTWLTHALHTLRTLLSFLPWDATHSSGCLGVTVELTRCFVDIFIPLSSSGVALSSQNFSVALFVLQQASRSVDRAYSLPSRALHHGEDGQRTYSSDMFSVPILQDDTETATQTARQQPSNRLVVIWRKLYRLALRYQEELCHQRGQGVIKNELEKMSVIIAQVQQALQSAGDRLQESHTLRSFTGEQHFISGKYAESVQVWRAELWAEREKAGPMTCYLETRYCLALLYAQLFQYRLREAQGLCDRLAHQLQSRQEEEDMPGGSDEAVCECWLSGPVGREAACAVVQSLGRFMAAYFTNRPLCILPPHNVDVLPPLHLPNNTGVRVVELSQARAAVAVRFDQLSEVWTVDYALELLLLGGLIPEAVWMAQRLGDWKMAATLGLAYSNHCSGHLDFSSLQWRELHLPTELKPAVIFHDQLETLLGRMLGSGGDGNKDAVSVEDVDLLQVSVQEILKASVMAEVDVVSQPLTRLMNAAKERATSLPALVPPAFYLPAPPLYCPQPSPNTQDSVRDPALVLETETRCQVSGLLQKVLMIFRAAHGSLPATQWYISNLHRSRHLLNKIQKKVSEPKAELIPDGLKKFLTHRGFFQSGPSKDMDSVTTQMIICFRELCALCWMLHVRDQLTITCRRYQTARTREKDSQVSAVSVSDVCVEALCWARRLLPFCRFMNAEEALQDLVLSLVSDLPPSHVTAETLARVFPDESESVRVPLREKYTSLVQRLRPVVVPDTSTPDVPPGTEREDEGDTMMILIQDQLRQRRRELRRLEKYLVAAEPYLWEREEEEDRGAAASILKRLSLGTSLSDSTLTDCGRPLVYSEGDTAETLSETLSPQSAHSSRTAKFHDAPEKSKQDRKETVEHEEPESSRKGSSVPAVGSWEFELEDDEYLLFLDLFLSYVLGKDRLDAEESELPLLSSFSQRFHARELHSVTFDMLTSLKRRQKDGRQRGARLPRFRAGHCFQTLPVTPEPVQDTHDTTHATSPWTLPGIQARKHQGLFSRRQHHTSTSRVSRTGSDVDSTGFRILSPDELGVQMQLDSSMEIRFPRLARLLEWMMRWADRRVLLAQPMGKRSEGSDAVVIRVKGSTPAVLSALELLEERYSAALLGENTHYKRLHQGAGPDAPVLQPITGWGRGRDSSVDTPITLHRHSPDVCEPENVVDITDDQLSEHEDTMTSDLQNNVTEIRQATEAEDVDSSADDVSEASWANQSRAHRDQTITLADLECPDTDEHSLHSQSRLEGNHVSCGTQRPEVSAPISVQHVNVPTETHIRGPPPHSEAQTPADPVRQLLQDELFRLVQLQQINFMSLMQVVGASFVNLPLSQPSMHQANVNVPQTTAIPAQPQPQPISLTHNAQHTTYDDTSLPTRAPRPETVNNDEHPVNSGSTLNPNITLKTQELHQLTIRSDWPESAQSPSRSFIPTSHGLLTTANNPKAPGLRLLQLNPSQSSPPPLPAAVKDSWAPDPSPSDPTSVPRAEGRDRSRAESHRYNTHTQESLHPHRSVALPLLRFHPETQRTVTLPHIPQCTLAKPSLGVSATGRYPRIQLLHREPDPPAADLRFSASPVRTPRLIPLEELLKWTDAKHTKLQLLNTPPVPENRRTTSSPSSKRRKRREEKNKEDKIGVTFRPEDSIIPPDEPAEEVPDQNDAYSIPLDVDSELRGLALLDQAYVTSAELHAFASTQKRPPEIRDACTNTDSELPRSITDRDVSVQPQSPPSMPSAPEGGLLDVVPPDVFLNLRYSKHKSSDQPEARSLAESHTDLSPEGRRFINVIDLTDDFLLQNLPSFPPSSAELHLLAASAVNPAPSAVNPASSALNPASSALNSATNNTEHFTENPVGEIPGVCVSPEAVLGGDPVTLSELNAVHRPGVERALMSRTQISARLSEMDSQLLRLQSIADHMDREFANTRLLVNRIETLSSVKKPLSSLTQEVRSYCPSPQRFGPDREDEEVMSSVLSRCSVHQERSPPAVKPEQSKRDTNPGLTESLLEDPGNGEETLGVSGLSDVKDILCELIRDGALSRSVLDLSQSGALHLSRSEVSPSGAMMEEERRDLRMWMRRKQRERLMEYRKQRDEKRESERRPFISPLTRNPTSVDLATNKKSKEERDRMVLQEHHEQRARDACSLITDLLTTPLNLPTIPHETLRSRSQSSGKNKRIPKNQSGPHRRSASSLGKTVVLQGKSAGKAHGSLNQRLGLHRPASDLPGDRLSQVTRRGMLTDPRPRRGTQTAHPIVMKKGLHTSTAKPRVKEKDHQTHVEERAAVSPDDIHRTLLLGDHDVRQGEESFTSVDYLRDLDLDSLSTGSVLSKLDWAAIERLVAEDEQN